MAYDLVIIGTGSGGSVCALRAAQLGLSVAVVERHPTGAGARPNDGCIASKALLHASERFEEARHGFDALGIGFGAPELDLGAMMKHQSDAASSYHVGVRSLLERNKVVVFVGLGFVPNAGKVDIVASDGSRQTLDAKAICIATGSTAAGMDGVEADGRVIVTSQGALNLLKVPERLIVVGAGAIGVEVGSIWNRLGAKVEIVESRDRILPGMDGETAKHLQRLLEKQGITFRLGMKAVDIIATGGSAAISIEPADGGDADELVADVALVAIGRRPNSEGLGLENLGVSMNGGGIVVDARFRTNVPGIYAIGDVVGEPMLAHKAEDEGAALAEIVAGHPARVNYGALPRVIYTMPEVAAVGRSEEELNAEGIAYTVGRFPFTANSRARAMRHTAGFAKVLADAATDRVLGVHIIGVNAGDLIAEATLLMELGGSSEDMARTCHAHPTTAEGLMEAAMAVEGRAIHI